MDDVLDRLLTEVHESAIQQARLVERVSALVLRLDRLESLYDRVNELERTEAKRGEQLEAGVKHFARLDAEVEEKVDKRNVRWLLVGLGLAGGAGGGAAIKLLLTLFGG